jgi:hypothetical protein
MPLELDLDIDKYKELNLFLQSAISTSFEREIVKSERITSGVRPNKSLTPVIQ